jgi:hypothetical protein
LDAGIKNESLEESIFKTLSNQKRRDILRFIGEHKQATFTEIKKAVEIEDSSSDHITSPTCKLLSLKKTRNTPYQTWAKKPTT